MGATKKVLVQTVEHLGSQNEISVEANAGFIGVKRSGRN